MVAGDRRRAPRLPRGRGALRRDVLRQLDVVGEGAADFLERLCDNRVARDVGTVTYTQMLNERGGIECDFTVTRLGEDRRIVTGTAFGQHDAAWIRSHAPDDGSVLVEDVTSRFASACGARRRAISSSRSPMPTSATSRSHARAQLSVGHVRASPSASHTSASSAGSSTARRSSAGVSGTRSGRREPTTAWSRAATRRSTRSGWRRAIYRVWGADITPDETPYEAGLGFAVKLDKGDFIGRQALVDAQERAPERKLAPRPRRPALRRARLGARAHGRRDPRAR